MDLETWQSSNKFSTLLDFAASFATNRQLRLLAAYGAFRIDDYGGYDDEGTHAICVAMLYADGLVSEYELKHVKDIALEWMHTGSCTAESMRYCVDAVTEVEAKACLSVFDGLDEYYNCNFPDDGIAYEWRYHSETLRDIIRHPDAPPIDCSKCPPRVMSLAQRAYDLFSVTWDVEVVSSRRRKREYTRTMSEFMEGLEASEVDRRIVDHFRATKRHVRGCWALDAILRQT